MVTINSKKTFFGRLVWRWRITARNNKILSASSESFAREEIAKTNLYLTHIELGKHFEDKDNRPANWIQLHKIAVAV